MKKSELKDKEVKIKREIEELFFKPIVVYINDMDKFEEKEIKKIGPIKNALYDWLTNYIPEPITGSVDSFKIKLLVFLRQIQLNKQCMEEERN